MIYILYARSKWFSFLFGWEFLAMTENLEDIKKRAEKARKDGFRTAVYGRTVKDDSPPIYYRKNKPNLLVIEEET